MVHNLTVPGDDGSAHLAAHIAAFSGLTLGVARRIVADVVANYAEYLEDYVVRRHRELAVAGWRNEAIFRQLSEEIDSRPFRVRGCSMRQIRRMIYG